jgi:formate dehydrogenase assembly factor FdhD
MNNKIKQMLFLACVFLCSHAILLKFLARLLCQFVRVRQFGCATTAKLTVVPTRKHFLTMMAHRRRQQRMALGFLKTSHDDQELKCYKRWQKIEKGFEVKVQTQKNWVNVIIHHSRQA